MVIKRVLAAMLPVFAIALIGCNSENVLSTSDSIDTFRTLNKIALANEVVNIECGDPLVIDLLAGQTIASGTVTVSNDENTTCITYETSGDWVILETHLHIADSKEGIPQTRKGNPKVGNFDYGDTFSQGVTSAEYCFNTQDLLADIGSSDECFVLAAHAVVARVDNDGNVIQTETAWGNGDRFTDKGSWATLFDYCVQPCDEEPPGPGDDCETAFAYSDEYGTCFLGISSVVNPNGTTTTIIDPTNTEGDFNRWGWTIGPLSEGEYDFEIWAAAGQCNLNNGYLAGNLNVVYQNGTATITYTAEPGVVFEEAHLYVGNDILPSNNGQYTVAPGQYSIVDEFDEGQVSVEYTASGFVGDIFVIAHAVSCK